MINRHRQQIDELKDIYVAFDRYFLQKEQTARSEYGNIRDGMKNKVDCLLISLSSMKCSLLKTSMHYE